MVIFCCFFFFSLYKLTISDTLNSVWTCDSESDCLEAVNLLNHKTTDLTKVKFVVDEANNLAQNRRDISFSHTLHQYNVLSHSLSQKAMAENCTKLLQILHP